MKKKLIFVLLIIMLSGCTSNVDINVTSNGKINENIEMKDEKQNVYTDDSYDKYIDDLLEFYFPKSEINTYNLTKNTDGDFVEINANKNYEYGLCDNISLTKLKLLMGDLKCEKKHNIYTITGTPTYLTCGDDCYEYPSIDNINLNITLPTKAIESNADYVEENIHTWHFSINDGKKLKLKFRIDKNSSNSNSKINLPMIIIIIIGVLTLLGVTAFVLYKLYKRNDIEY